MLFGYEGQSDVSLARGREVTGFVVKRFAMTPPILARLQSKRPLAENDWPRSAISGLGR